MNHDVTMSSGHLVAPDEYRHAMRRVAAGISVLTTTDGRHDLAMTLNSVTSVSLDPPLQLAVIHNEARCLEALLESKHWIINVLPASARHLATRFAEVGRPSFGQLDRVDHTRSTEDLACLDVAIARFHCRLWAQYPGGDHTIVVGSVVRVEVPVDVGPGLFTYRGEMRSVD
ncbi:p-hydroxyphenylacetate 3-hydroxylase, reductase component [Dermatophilus congolensis]|uniref:p-hydroxyphenylacetate 3-hydroxylase, reductase component n=2 Tax=Dermatophilus congolensis TaxID=1863 RepID=A0AA46BNN6_9MICO|nr:p-hydroxyphenylacetate 3-hydroxylase, reductase component [Dermatophilus congolensis]